jgi:hypothetical protein
LDIYVDTPGMQLLAVHSLIQKSFPAAESRVLLEAIRKRKPARGCCARSFDFTPALWTLRVAIDPYVPDMHSAMAWCSSLFIREAQDFDDEEGESEPLLRPRARIPLLFNRTRARPHPKGRVLRCGAQIDDKTYNLKIPAACLHLQYEYEDVIKFPAAPITLEATSLGGESGTKFTNILYRITFDHRSVLSCCARVSRWDENIAKKQDIIRPIEMQPGVQSTPAGHHRIQQTGGRSIFPFIRAYDGNATGTDTGTQAGVFELELKPASIVPEVADHFSQVRRTGAETKTWLHKKLASHQPLQVMDALDVALNSIQEATKLWIWIELRDADDVDAFQTLAEQFDRPAT